MNENSFFKKTKIVATIGPKTQNEKTMTALANAGMDVARLNLSHGDHAEHLARIRLAKKISKKIKRPIAVLTDLAGPKIRIGDFYQEKVMLKKGGIFTLTTKKITGDETKAWVNYPKLPGEVRKGGTILLDDGKKRLEVVSVSKNSIRCRIIVGGETKGRRGLNLPGAYLKISAITEKDEKDLAFGLKNGADFIGLSFVRQASDILKLRAMLKKAKSDAAIISKIETAEAIENLDEIIKHSDGIMVARGDLAIEIPAQDVPLIQKEMIEKCNRAGKPVITATQMLESMIRSPIPTRAEVSDVANSILDGSDAVMLSEETTLGEYPVEAVAMMRRIARRVEEAMRPKEFKAETSGIRGIVDAVSFSVVKVADQVGAKAIVALTESGFTARMVSRFKPHQPIVVMTPYERTQTKLALSFGCLPIKIKKIKYVNEVTELANKLLLEKKIAQKGDKVVIVAGVPFGKAGATNTLLVHTV